MKLTHFVAVCAFVLLCGGCGSGASEPAAAPKDNAGSEAVFEPGLDRKPSASDPVLDVPEDACDESPVRLSMPFGVSTKAKNPNVVSRFAQPSCLT